MGAQSHFGIEFSCMLIRNKYNANRRPVGSSIKLFLLLLQFCDGQAPDKEKPSKITLVGHLFSTNFFCIVI